VDPIRTWIPWNPVAIKKVEPKVESDIENGASMYSNPCSTENSIPNIIVIINLIFDLLKFFLTFHGEIMLLLPLKIVKESYLLMEFLSD